MDKPIPLIRSDKGTFILDEEAAKVLAGFQGKIGVVAIAGLYRTGKSFILNKLLNRERSGFTVGPTIKACTKGIWVWGKPVPHELPSGEKIHLVYIDTEGIGSLDQTQTHDAQIFALALLLSSYFIYNSLGNIGEQALDQLSLVVNLTNHIHVRSATGKRENADELARYFPSLLWVVRDFSLRLEDEEGRPITSREYMESALAPRVPPHGGHDERVVQKNKIRTLLSTFFKDRDCVTMVRPILDEGHLQNLDKLPYGQCREEFREQMDRLKQKVMKNVGPKQLNGVALTGPMFVHMVRAYVDALNKGHVPTIESAWEGVVKLECHNAVEVAVKAYREHVDKMELNLPLDEADIEKANLIAREYAYDTFRKKAIGTGDLEPYLKLIRERLDRDFALLKSHNEKASRTICEDRLRALWTRDKIDTKPYTSFVQFETDRDKLMKEYLTTVKGPTKLQVLSDVLPLLSHAVTIRIKEAQDAAQAKLQQAADEKSRQAEADRRHLQQSLDRALSDAKVEKERLLKEKDTLTTRLEQTRDKSAADIATLQKKLEEMDRTRSERQRQFDTSKAELEAQLKGVEKELDLARRELESLRRTLDGTKRELETAKRDLVTSVSRSKAEQDDSARTHSKLRADLEAATGQLKEAKDEISRLNADLNRTSADVVAANHKNAQLASDLKKQNDDFLAARGSTDSHVASLQKERSELQDKIATLETTHADATAALHQEKADLESKLAAVESDRANVERLLNAAETRDAEASRAMSDFERKHLDTAAELDQLREELSATKARVQELRAAAETATKENEDSSAELRAQRAAQADAEQAVADAEARCKDVKAELETAREDLRQRQHEAALFDEAHQAHMRELALKDEAIAAAKDKADEADSELLLVKQELSSAQLQNEHLRDQVARERANADARIAAARVEPPRPDNLSDRPSTPTVEDVNMTGDEDSPSPVRKSKKDEPVTPGPSAKRGRSGGKTADFDPSKLVEDPGKLTKVELKRALTHHDIPFPGVDKAKQYYVDLYREHLLDQVKTNLRG